MTLSLTALPGRFRVVRLDVEAALPAWFSLAAPLAAACRTTDELSLLSPEADVPAAVPAERDLRAFKVAGPLDFVQTGILAASAGPLGAAEIPIFALSTFEIDYVLVPAARFGEAWKNYPGASTLQPKRCRFPRGFAPPPGPDPRRR